MNTNTFKKTLLAVAIATTALSSTNVFAGWNSVTTATPIIIQAKTPTTNAATSVEYTFSSSQGLIANDTVTFTLTGGAKFKSGTSPGLNISDSLPLGSPSASFLGFLNNDTTARFLINGEAGASDVLSLPLDTIELDLSGVAEGDVVDVALSTFVGTGTTVKNSLTEDLFSSESGGGGDANSETGARFLFKAKNLLTCTGVSTTDTLEVNSVFRAFDADSTDFTGDSVAINLTSNAAVADTITADKLLLSVAGSFGTLASVSATGFTAAKATGDADADGTADFFSSGADGTAYASNTYDLAGQASLVPNPVFILDSTTSQTAQNFDFEVKVLDDTLWKPHTVVCDTNPTTYNLVRNGSSFVMNTFGVANILKITDTSGAIPEGSGIITIVGYDRDGVKLDSAFVPPSLSPHSTVVINGRALRESYASLFEAVKFEVSIESGEIIATNQKNTGGVKTLTVYRNGLGVVPGGI